MLMMKFQESPGGENVISHLLPPALTMRSDSISFAVTCTSVCWWLDGTTCARDSVLCVPAENQPAGHRNGHWIRVLCWHFLQDTSMRRLSHIFVEYMLRSPCIYCMVEKRCKLKTVWNSFTNGVFMGKCQKTKT